MCYTAIERIDTQEILDTLQEDAEALDDAIDVQEAKKRERDIQAQLRVQKGNVFYTLLADLAKIGKVVFAKDPAKYNDYVLFASTTSKAPSEEEDNEAAEEEMP